MTLGTRQEPGDSKNQADPWRSMEPDVYKDLRNYTVGYVNFVNFLHCICCNNRQFTPKEKMQSKMTNSDIKTLRYNCLDICNGALI